MSQTAQSMEEILTFGYLFKILTIPTTIGTVTGLASAYVKNKDETTFGHILSNCGVSMIFCWMSMLLMYEWTAISPHMKIMLCIAIGFTATHWNKHLISIIYMIIERFLPLSKREQLELRRMRRNHELEETEYRSPKRMPKEFLDDDDGSIGVDFDNLDDPGYCNYPPDETVKPKKKPTVAKEKVPAKPKKPTVKGIPVEDTIPKKKPTERKSGEKRSTTKSRSKKDVPN